RDERVHPRRQGGQDTERSLVGRGQHQADVLARHLSGPPFNAVASDRGHGSGFWGFSMLWTNDTVPAPGTYQVGLTADVNVFVHRRHPAESGNISYSSAGAG